MSIERERKYLLSASDYYGGDFVISFYSELMNRTSLSHAQKILQYYIVKTENEEVRIRRSHMYGTYMDILCIKKGSGEFRKEFETPISKDVFNSLCKEAISGINKTRFTYKDNVGFWEIDVFHNSNVGLILLEIELPESFSGEVTVPEWIKKFVVKEVTNDSAFKNVNLAVPMSSLPPSK